MAGEPERAKHDLREVLECCSRPLTLDVDTPFLRVEVEGLERTLLAEALCLIDELVTSIVALAGVTL